MEASDDCFFFTQKDAVIQNVNSTEAVVALARKLHAVQKHKESHHGEDGPPKSFTPDLEPIEPEQRKSTTPVPAFSSTWNPDEQPLKYIFDKFRWDAFRLLNELAVYLYGYQWASINGSSGAKLHPRLIYFLQLEYDELTEGCSVVYYRWQSSKYQERYLVKLRSNPNEHEAAASVAASGTARGFGTSGSSSSLLTEQQRQQQQITFRSRLGSAASVSRSERSTTTGTSHDGPSAKQNKGRRKVPSPILADKISEVSDENQSTKGGDRHAVPRVQFLWSTTARQKEKDATERCEQPILTTSIATNAALISAESMPPGLLAKAFTREPPPAAPPNDYNRSMGFLKRAVELFAEMARKRKEENIRWLESGRIFACRVVCYGDRRVALMSRSKSAVVPPAVQDVSASVPTAATTALPSSRNAVSSSVKSPRPLTAAPNIAALSSADIVNSSTSPFTVLSSLNTAIQRIGFHVHDALQGKIPRIIPEAPAYRRNIFLATLPDGSYSLYYPNGKPAVVQSCYFAKSFPTPSHTTTLAYDHTAVGDLIVVATPTSLYAYAPKFDKRLYADSKNLTIITAEINVETYPNWQSRRLKSSITFEVNDHMTLVLFGPDRISLTYNNQATAESFKFALGFNLNVPVPTADVKHLQTVDVEFQSKSAYELIKSSTKVKTLTSQQSKNYSTAQRSPAGTMTKSEQIAKKLGFIDNSYVNDASNHLKRLKNKISWICESWLSHYCLWLGVTEIRGLAIDKPPSRLFNKRLVRRMAHSAGAPATHSLSDDEHNLAGADSSLGDEGSHKRRRAKRAASSEAKPNEPSTTSVTPPPPPPSNEPQSKEKQPHRTASIVPKTAASIDAGHVSQLDRVKVVQRSNSPSLASSPVPAQNTQLTLVETPLKLPPNSALTEFHLVGLCPVTLRQHMTGGLDTSSQQLKYCRCSRQKPPIVTDVELDLFFTKFSRQNQMIVVQVVDSLSNHGRNKCGIKATPIDQFEAMYDDLYSSLSTYRPRPCVDSISDRFRLVRYDLAAAVTSAVANSPPTEILPSSSSRRVPLLIRRHNVRRGMTLMYHGGGLIFCGFITPSNNDALLRQIEQSWRLALRSFSLPPDYRINMSVTFNTTSPEMGRQTDAFVAKYLAKNREKVKSQEATGDQHQQQDIDEAIMSAAFLAREGPHSAREFPCLHVPTA